MRAWLASDWSRGCTAAWGRAAGRTPAWAHHRGQQRPWAPRDTPHPSYRAQPGPCSTSHSAQQRPQGPRGASHPSQQRPWAPLTPRRLQLWLPSRVHHVLFPGPSSGQCSSPLSYLSPSASSWHHTALLARMGLVPAPRARLGKQAGGDSFPKQLKETEPPLSHARQVSDRS